MYVIASAILSLKHRWPTHLVSFAFYAVAGIWCLQKGESMRKTAAKRAGLDAKQDA